MGGAAFRYVRARAAKTTAEDDGRLMENASRGHGCAALRNRPRTARIEDNLGYHTRLPQGFLHHNLLFSKVFQFN